MSINLITKYGPKLDKGFERRSLTAGKASKNFTWDGAEGIKILHTLPTPLHDYTASGSDRFGPTTDVQDAVQYMKITQKKSYSVVIDKVHNSMQDNLKKAAEYMRQQDMDEYIPFIDNYNLTQWAKNAGRYVIAPSDAAAKIVESLVAVDVQMNNDRVPKNQRWAYIGETMLSMVSLSEYWRGCDGIVNKVLMNGHVGNFRSLHLIAVPDDDMPQNVYVLATYKGSVYAPTTLSVARILREAKGYSGPVMEALRVFDAFVDYPKCNGVCALLAPSKQETAPTVSTAGQITVASGKTVKYTTDGTDPRYSDSASTITSTTTPTHAAGDTIKAVVLASGADKYQSAVTSVVTAS